MKNDSVRVFMLSTIEHFYGNVSLNLDNKSEVVLTDFISNCQTLLIQSYISDGDSLSLDTQIQDTKGKSLIFYKNPAENLGKGDNIEGQINVISLCSSPAESLYHTLRLVYSPLLTAENDVYSIKLQKNFSDLEAILRTLAYGKSETSINIILSVEDELEYWKTVIQRKEVNKKEREAAATFSDLFQDICEEIKVLQSSPVSEMREAAENIGGLLDDVWRFTSVPYAQNRMVHIFDILGHVICSTVQKEISSLDVWAVGSETKDYEVLTLLSDGLKVVQTWNSACKSLTETYWPNYALHAWSGNAYIPLFCQKFESRLKEIHDIRSTHSQLNKLLSNNEKSELQTDKLFSPFQNVNIWMCNGANASWDTAVSKFTASLRPAEAKIAEKLKPRLHNTSTKQMLYEFVRYRSLIERPLVKHALNNELEIFVSSLLSLLTEIQQQLESDEMDVKMYQPPEMSSLVHQIQWAKQAEAKVKEIQTCAERYLKEFAVSSELLRMATQLSKDLKTMYTQLHEEWSRDLQAQAKNGLLQLSTNKPVVEFSSETKMMEVVFNPRLVWAELEARSLAALGFPSPPAAAALDSIATALTHARALQQVASFHNTLGERMIPSTRPMMLQAALDLSALVQNQKAVYWDDMEQLSNYTDKLKKAVLKLETQNTYLTSQHVAIRSIVEKLLETELLAKQSEWKKSVKDIRDIIEKVEANGYKNTDLWRTHWDWQLYKALECQYIKTLLSLHKHFPSVRVELVLRNRCVRPQPCMEELRVQHYHQLRRLVALPAHFVGLTLDMSAKGKQSIFAAIVEKHGWLGNKAVKQLEAALSSLERTCRAWTKRAALACVPDLQELCSQHLKQPADWEANFKACKAYGQAVAKMTFEDEKIEWITVGTASLRREFEAQTRALWSCLMSTLQTSCGDDAATLEAFVATAQTTLQDRAMPKNAKELAEISAKQQALRDKMPEMESTMEALKKKVNLLRTWGGDASVDGTVKEWQKIRELMISQQQMFEHQAEIVKSSLKGDWENLNTSVEAFVSRWSQAKPRLEETRDVTYSTMLERCQSVLQASEQWAEFQKEKEELVKECLKFNMAIEISEIWSEAETMMAEFLDLWTVFKQYNDELESLADQDWIIFQKKLHLLEEFVSKWKGSLEPYTVVTLFLQQELEKYSDLSIVLKYLRGTDFTERHWREVFSLLDMECKKPETLQLKDLLLVAPNIKKQVKSLQKICASASSESAIRSALNELELWFAGARFTIIYYDDKSKRQTPIVKDFKEISTKIEEQQWIVSSLSGGGGGTGAGADACAAWDLRLRAARRLARAAHHAQRRWLYLEPILSNEEGELASKFRKVDQGFRQVARLMEADPRLSALLQSTRLQPMLDSISEQLLACQTALNQYIDEKRSIFPRLYFLSDDDLLELLGQARAGAEGRAAVMQTHLKKLFPGATGVNLGPGDMSVTALRSLYGETLQLDHPVDIDCPVEVWLKNLESEMRSSLKNLTMKCVLTNSLQNQDPFSLPTQILCLAQNIRFTEQAERAITSRDLHKLKANVEKQNSYYAAAELEDECERNKKQALILQCAHYMSVIKTLIDKNVTSTSDWLWQKQLRFYISDNKDVVAKMGLAQIPYSYEYLGINTGQFVRTELADDCFLILTQSLHLGMVGNPFGPAGTGKTESVKALGGLVGRLVLIFNCDEAMDSECFGRLLSGLAVCGAWGCFDEFNRLSADTLAAAAVLLQSLLSAQGSTGFTALLNGKQVAVSPWCGVAATMNPAGRGYLGRRALPPALERVMRPVAMLAPRADILAHHLLAAGGVPHHAQLASDLYNVFTMAGALITDERHYDWGLRALKASVCSAAASLANKTHIDISVEKQRAALRRLLARDNLSKLTKDSAIRFENILSLIFGDIAIEEPDSDDIKKSIEDSVNNLKLAYNELQIKKCGEFYEQLQQRMGVVIVGPPGSGKTTIRRMLKNALTHQGKNIVEYTICPKAMNRDWLLGNIDHDTRQWTDGVISTTALEVSNQPTDVWSWVVCDGDIDPEWVEALNSVLDDNRLLTLPSGWRVQFGANVNFVFETHSLEHASPATVSRMGVILLSEDASCGLDLLSNWVQRSDIEQETARAALPVLRQAIDVTLHWLLSHKSDLVLKLHSVAVVQQILVQFEYLVQNLGTIDRTSPEELVYNAIQTCVADVLKNNALDDLHQELSPVLGLPPPQPTRFQDWVSDALLLSPRLGAVEPAVRACLASHTGHLLLIGPDACAKNLLAEHVVKESTSTLIVIDCTPILEPADIIEELKRNNVVRSGGQNVGSNSSRVTLLVRSLHRAQVDVWGTSAVHSFLLQLIEYDGFWSRGGDTEGGANATWSSVAKIRVVATAQSAALAPRLAARLAVCVVQEADDDELLELVKSWLQQNADKNMQPKDIIVLAGTILTMFKEVTETFHSRPQYKWNAAHLKLWCENVKWYSPTTLEQLDMAITAEANAIFRDRLVTEEEKSTFNIIMRKYFKTGSELYFECRLRADGIYMEPVDYGLWHHNTEKLINQCLSEYDYNTFGDSGAEISSELVVLCDAMARACNGGLSVCVGSAGVGRRAAALITAAAVSASTLFVQHPNHFYNIMKNAISSAGQGSRTLVVLCECAARSQELALVEALRRAAHPLAVPAPLRTAHIAQEELDNIKSNLGIVICQDERQDNLPDLWDKFPMIYNDAHLLWLNKWSHDTLIDMSKLVIQRLAKENMSEVPKEEFEKIPAESFVKIYDSLDTDAMKAPCRFVQFVKSYFNIIVKKKASLRQRQTTLAAGVEALRRARSEVAKLQAEAAEQETLLSEKQAKANSALDQISATVRATTDKKEEMHALKKSIEQENEKLQVQKKEIEAELASVEPVIAAARAAVGDIKPESLSEVRSLRAPPDVVRDVLEGVLRLMGIADTSWHSMKNFLSKRGVKEDIRCLDASQISPAALSSVQKLVASRSTSFTAAAAKRASAACAPLAAWVRANIDYAQALQRVQPLKDHQLKLHRNLQEAEDQLAALSSGLATVDERVAALKDQLGQHTREAAALELKLSTATETIRTATTLIDQLAGEYTAWQADLEKIQTEILGLSERCMLAAAFLVYLPEATEPETRHYIKQWSTLLGFEDEAFSAINFLSTAEKQLQWEAEGLSTDLSAVKNAVLIDQVLESPKCGVTPLVIDPDVEGLTWLQSSLHSVCDIVSQHSDKLLTTVQYAVRLGRVLVITDVDGVHPCWVPLLQGLPPVRLILVTRDENLPNLLPPHLARRLSPVPFTARLHPLTDQLINYALQQQNPDISEKSKEIKLQKTKLQKQQHELQENLLRELSRNGDILHDAALLASLNSTRDTALTVRTALVQAKEVEAAVDAARAHLAGSARRAAALTLAVKKLHVRWPLVTLPIDDALQAYVDAVTKVDQAKSEEVVKYLTRRTIERVLLALHKKDKYIVVLHLLKQVYDDLIPNKLWQLFIGIDEIQEAVDIKNMKKAHPWLPDESLRGVAKLNVANEDLYNRLCLNNVEVWTEFISSGDINELQKFKLSAFERVISVAMIRPDSLYIAIVAFVDSVIGPGVVFGGGAISIAARARRPVLLLAAHAHDALAASVPPHALTTVAASAGVNAWRAAVHAARSAGGWLALALTGAPFSPELQAFVAEAAAEQTEKCNDEFRLWILSEYREVPPLISNSCVNVILEAPEGVKNNVLGSVSLWERRGESAASARLLACLALFHALVQERRNYIPQGWSRWYSWEWGELAACARAAQSAGGAAGALSGALYAGRVQSAADAAVLCALHARCLPPAAAPPHWRPPALPALPPATADMQAYTAAFASLPDMDSPQLLGLPANCRAAWERNAARDIVTGLKELICTVAVSSNVEGATSSKSLASLWKKQMSGSVLLKEGWGVPSAGGWWGGAARGEGAAAARTSRRLHAELKALASQTQFVMHATPEAWQVWWAGPRAAHAYLREFCHRARAAVARLEQHQGDEYMPTEVDLRDFLCPSRAVWALRARTAETRKLPPASLVLSARLGEKSTSGEEMSLVGLRLSGAECGEGGLYPARAAAPPHVPAPPVHLKYITQEASGGAPGGWLAVPVYGAESREELLFTVNMQLSRSFPRDTALLNAVALFVAPLH